MSGREKRKRERREHSEQSSEKEEERRKKANKVNKNKIKKEKKKEKGEDERREERLDKSREPFESGRDLSREDLLENVFAKAGDTSREFVFVEDELPDPTQVVYVDSQSPVLLPQEGFIEVDEDDDLITLSENAINGKGTNNHHANNMSVSIHSNTNNTANNDGGRVVIDLTDDVEEVEPVNSRTPMFPPRGGNSTLIDLTNIGEEEEEEEEEEERPLFRMAVNARLLYDLLSRGRQVATPFTAIFHPFHRQSPAPAPPKKRKPRTQVERKKVEGEDCPICQEPLNKKQKIVWCKFGCGGNLHSSCWGKWKKEKGRFATCVLCRQEWS